jgi:hypothetical protein
MHVHVFQRIKNKIIVVDYTVQLLITSPTNWSRVTQFNFLKLYSMVVVYTIQLLMGPS